MLVKLADNTSDSTVVALKRGIFFTTGITTFQRLQMNYKSLFVI